MRVLHNPRWHTRAERDIGVRSGLSSNDGARIVELEHQVGELCTANEVQKKVSAYFTQAELDRPLRK